LDDQNERIIETDSARISDSAASCSAPEGLPDDAFSLHPLAIVQMEHGNHFLKVRMCSEGKERAVMIPLDIVALEKKVIAFIARRCGVVVHEDHPDILDLPHVVHGLPRLVGSSRLGWTPDRDAFLYDGTPFCVSDPPKRVYEFIAPEGTLVKHSETALTPRGDRTAQYAAFRELWDRSPVFRLALSLAAISPFLEVIGAPSIPVHLGGPTGIGKTTLLRLVVSAYADPNSPMTCVDFSKDTPNYADAQLGMLHNFPILLDETTLRDPSDMAEAAYSIAAGRTKGRLTGPEQGYLPADTQSYRLVCFLSGEVSIRDLIEKRGAAARLVEIIVDEPLLPKGELGKWWGTASTHFGWFGRDLVERIIAAYFSSGKDGEFLKACYLHCRRKTERWCSDHPRLVDALASLQVGYVLVLRLLHHDFRPMTREEFEQSLLEAEAFAKDILGRLNKTAKIDHVLDAIAALGGMNTWIERGFIPVEALSQIADDFGLAKPGEFAKFLKHHGIIAKVESRKEGEVDGLRISRRSYILTPEGKKQLGEHSQTTE
jgi:hypothetical protein